MRIIQGRPSHKRRTAPRLKGEAGWATALPPDAIRALGWINRAIARRGLDPAFEDVRFNTRAYVESTIIVPPGPATAPTLTTGAEDPLLCGIADPNDECSHGALPMDRKKPDGCHCWEAGAAAAGAGRGVASRTPRGPDVGRGTGVPVRSVREVESGGRRAA